MESFKSYHGWQHHLENADRRDGSLGLSAFPDTWQRLWSYDSQSGAQLLRMPNGKQPVDRKVAKYSLNIAPQPLHFLQLGGKNLPWRLTALPPSPELQVLVYPSESRSDSDNGLAVAVTSDDAEAEALLSYMTAGNLEAAEIIAKKLLKLPETRFEKKPIEAVILGYYLLWAGDEQNYQEWLVNLTDKIEWLPDLPVIAAWLLLRTSNEPNVNQIKQYLMQAVDRGIPTYSQGLQLLLDGLRLIKQDALARNFHDDEIDGKLGLIETYVAATDWSQPLTTFYGTHPRTPSLNYKMLRTGIPDASQKLVWLTKKKQPNPAKPEPLPIEEITPSSEPTKQPVLSGQPPKFGGSTGGLLSKAEVEEKYAITWTSRKEQVFEMPTGGAAIMNVGANLLYLARKEQCIALSVQFRTQLKPRIEDYKIYRIYANGEVEYIHPADGVFPERVNEGRPYVGKIDRRIGKNPEPAKMKFTGKQVYEV